MHLDDYDYDEPKIGFMSKCALIASCVIVLIFALIIVVNKDTIINGSTDKKQQTGELTPEEKARIEEKILVESLTNNSTLTSEDLAFWDLYSISDESSAAEDGNIIEPNHIETAVALDPSEDGLHTKIVYSDGREEWVSINTHLEKNSYDFGGLVLDGELMKYYENSALKSFVGVNVSKADSSVNFYQLKRNGVDYAILKLGQRGYQSGEIALDEKFEEYLSNCIEAGMPFGVSFSTHAITKDEAVEEASFVVEKLNEFRATYEFDLDYPVIITLDPILNDSDRCDKLDKNERTVILNTLLPILTSNGYPVMIYANKEWLIQNMYLSHLTQYDICLDQVGDVPDYPYQFVMWHYSSNSVLAGAGSPLNMCISFIDFSIR